MNTFLFVAKPKFSPERVKDGQRLLWSCTSETRAGDRAYVYVTGTGICYEWRVLSDAQRAEANSWPFECLVEYVSDFAPPIPLPVLRKAVPQKDWNAPHSNMRVRGASIIPPQVVDTISSIRGKFLKSVLKNGDVELKSSRDLYCLPVGSIVTKRNLFDLIQHSKIKDSPCWSGLDGIINNTPQQGINWIGQPHQVNAVIIKARPGSYETDGWSDQVKSSYRYSFKARKGNISYTEMANAVLIKQPQYLYPILLFTEHSSGWCFEGTFSVSGIEDKYVELHLGENSISETAAPQDEWNHHEGGRKYVTHLMAERSRGAVKAVKNVTTWVCEICNEDFFSRYGVKYIEAHHKIPIATFCSTHTVKLADFALLCPNCHKAVHIYMRMKDYDYLQIRALLRKELIG